MHPLKGGKGSNDPNNVGKFTGKALEIYSAICAGYGALAIFNKFIKCWVDLDGRVSDPGRIDFVRRNLLQINRLLAEDIPVLGYMYWSFMDNYEWSEGYRIRFGIIHTNYQTLERTPKDSYYWYKEVIRTQGQSLLEPPNLSVIRPQIG